eukprot:m.149262 g.149262  ORF g.149262 m.149262 type:complete len:288 (+) comp17341_c2_seq4:192-1055(+)
MPSLFEFHEHSKLLPSRKLLLLALVFSVLLFFPPAFVGDHNLKLVTWALMILLELSAIAWVASHTSMRSSGMVVALGALILLSPWLIVAVSSMLSHWCCMRYSHLERLCDLATRTSATLDAANITHWICWGTLLGAVRHGDQPFQAVPWEHDFDICVFDKDWPRVVAAVRSDPGLFMPPPSMAVMDGTIRSRIARLYVDFSRFKPMRGGFLESRDHHHVLVRFPESDLLPLTTRQACNLDMPTPARAENVLEAFFHDWQTPRWPHGPTAVTCRIIHDCNLPEDQLPM